MNLLSDVERAIRQELSTLGYAPRPGDDLDAVLLRYINVLNRLPRVVAWDVRMSQDLASKRLPTPIQEGLEKFIEKAKAGVDLKPHVSTLITNPDYADLMFYDWGMLHFHLGTTLDSRGFIERTDELLFAITDPASAAMYLLDVLPHARVFTNKDLLRIVEDNWPQILARYTFSGIGLEWEAT